MDFQYIILGIILLVAMTAGIINLWIKRRKEKQNLGDSSLDSPSM
ncbi:MAG: hypothetical protein ACREAD_08615 [Nitrosopumilaceae archaeon]